MKVQLFILTTVLLSVVFACKSTEKLSTKKPKFNIELLYKVWDVESIMVVGGKKASGDEMGNPQYEFTNKGQRIKSFKTPAHSESVDYFVHNDSIHYGGEKPLPSSAIVELTEKRLVLKNEKAEWILYIK